MTAIGDVRIRVRDVISATARITGVPSTAFRTPYGRHVLYRQLAMALAVELTAKPRTDIAVVFGCEHTTVKYAERQMRARLRGDRDLAAIADRIRVAAAVDAAVFVETMRRAALPQPNTGRSA